ncbi:hypothetical protein [Nesterenkonia pannonica]|uniref:hypothetical protein n=1 Tax=Nesterenkonia pannonica TaxID=1548602 RepID=UPI0021642C17|nr:hypothetical protein [Nesterenkonia pannonica]
MSTALGHDSARTASPGARRSTLVSTGTLLRLMLRRNRVYTPAWVLGIALMGFYVAHAIQIVAETDQELANLTTMFTDPVGRMMTGPAFGMDAPTHERFFAAGYVLFIYILTALMSVFTVVRHTRAEEQSGRAELVRSNAVGRHAILTATLVLVTAANIIAAKLRLGRRAHSGLLPGRICPRGCGRPGRGALLRGGGSRQCAAQRVLPRRLGDGRRSAGTRLSDPHGRGCRRGGRQRPLVVLAAGMGPAERSLC